MTNITTERLEQIEQEREQTMYDEGFRKWFVELNVSQSYYEPSGKIRAREMMSLWTDKHGNLNDFKAILG